MYAAMNHSNDSTSRNAQEHKDRCSSTIKSLKNISCQYGSQTAHSMIWVDVLYLWEELVETEKTAGKSHRGCDLNTK